MSQQVTRLEQETGRTLLQRTATGSVLTSAGLALAERKPYADGLGLAWLSRSGEPGPAPR